MALVALVGHRGLDIHADVQRGLGQRPHQGVAVVGSSRQRMGRQTERLLETRDRAHLDAEFVADQRAKPTPHTRSPSERW